MRAMYTAKFSCRWSLDTLCYVLAQVVKIRPDDRDDLDFVVYDACVGFLVDDMTAKGWRVSNEDDLNNFAKGRQKYLYRLEKQDHCCIIALAAPNYVEVQKKQGFTAAMWCPKHITVQRGYKALTDCGIAPAKHLDTSCRYLFVRDATAT